MCAGTLVALWSAGPFMNQSVLSRALCALLLGPACNSSFQGTRAGVDDVARQPPSALAPAASRDAAVTGDAAAACGETSGGEEIWRNDFGGGSALVFSSVAVDSAGGVLVATGSSTVGFDSKGQQAWSVPFGSLVTTDKHGSTYVAGTFTGTMRFGDDGCVLTSSGGTDVFVVR